MYQTNTNYSHHIQKNQSKTKKRTKNVTQPFISHSIVFSHNYNFPLPLFFYVFPLNLPRNNIHEKIMNMRKGQRVKE